MAQERPRDETDQLKSERESFYIKRKKIGMAGEILINKRINSRNVKRNGNKLRARIIIIL